MGWETTSRTMLMGGKESVDGWLCEARLPKILSFVAFSRLCQVNLPSPVAPTTTTMPVRPAIRLAAKSTKSTVKHLYLQCHVKPGVTKQREGVVSVSDALIEVCVSAHPEDGLANLSVRNVFSDVYLSCYFFKPSAYCSRCSNVPSPT
jgi:hypothetical protein